MSLRDDRLRPDPRYNQQGSSFRPKPVGTFNNVPNREAKRYPGIIVVRRHSQPPCTDGDNGAERIPCAEQVVPNSELVVPSPVFREEPMRNIADELQQVVFKAAGPIKPGMGIQAQVNAACDNLGYRRGNWRVRSAWYGYADNWNAKAVFDLLDRYNRFLRRQQGVEQDNVADIVSHPLAEVVKAREQG